MAELIPTASEAEWLEARRKGITASEISVVLGLSPWDSPYALFHRKLGILPPIEDNAAMERGRVLEPYVVEKFAAAHEDLMVAGTGRELFAHDDRPWQMATPDRLLTDDMRMDFDGERVIEEFEPVALLETKTASDMSDWGEPGTDEIPVHYRAQVLWQMDVMGVAKAYVAVLDIKQWQVREYIIEHHPSHVDRLAVATPDYEHDCDICIDVIAMRKEAESFLFSIEVGAVPDVDWRPATIGALKALHPSVTDEDVIVSDQLGSWYHAACRNAKHWEQRKKLYEARIRQAMGSARRAFTAVGSEPVARRDVYEVRESVRKAYTVDKLVAVPPKTKKES